MDISFAFATNVGKGASLECKNLVVYCLPKGNCVQEYAVSQKYIPDHAEVVPIPSFAKHISHHIRLKEAVQPSGKLNLFNVKFCQELNGVSQFA